jgi:nitric oxide reductase subunit B
MKYRTQRLALPFFQVAVVLFAVQVIFGLIAAAQYVWPGFLFGALDFNVAKEVHINLLVFWLIFGFMGASYFMVPEEAKTDIYSPTLAWVHFWLLLLAGVIGVIGYIFFEYTVGRKFLELPLPLASMVAVSVIVFIINLWLTIRKSKRWTTVQLALMMGLIGAAVFYIPGQIPFASQTVQSFYRWWTIHLWVEGVWVLIMGAILAFLLVRLTGFDHEVVDKWLYLVIGLALFTGLLGIGHHYYWIGAPEFWLLIGGIFSSLEPLSFLAMIAFAWRMTRKNERHHPNKLALFWTIGTAITAFIGAGVLGFAQTLPVVNQYTHGSQVTASHGHLAFFGAYAMLNLAMMSYAIPELKDFKNSNARLGNVAFWIMVVSMFAMSLVLFVAGILQSYFERLLGFEFFYAQNFMGPWFLWRFIFGVTFLGGVLLFSYDFLRVVFTAPDRSFTALDESSTAPR